MMRWLVLAVLVVSISAASAWISLSTPSDGALPGVAYPSASIGEKELTGPPPSIVLNAPTTFDFGIMGQEDFGSREFVVGNEGPGDLRLIGTQPTCSCTVANLQPGQVQVVPPGEQFAITIRWETRQFSGKYEKSAQLETNDPNRPVVTFVVQGSVQPDLVTFPESGSVDLRQISNDKPVEASAVVASPSRPETVIESISTSRPDFLSVTHRALNEEELGRLSLTGGHQISVEVQPGTELGPFREEIIITTDHPKRPEIRLSVSGTVVGPISAVPPSLRMSNVYTNRGEQRSVIFWVRDHDSTHFEVVEKPEALNVTIVPVDDKDKDKDRPETRTGRAYRMDVSVRPGASPGVIQTPIVLKTDHPRAGEFRMPVEITILGEG